MKNPISPSILSEDSEPTETLLSLESVRSRITSEQLDGLVMALFGEAGGQLDPEPHYALSMCMLNLIENGALHLRVMHPDQKRAFLIRPEVIKLGHAAFDLWETLRHGFFVGKPTLMRHMSLDVQLQGQAIYVSRREAMNAFRFGPTSDARTKMIISALLDREAKQGTRPSAMAVIAEVLRHPEVREVSKTHIKKLLNELKPLDMKKAGRPRKSKSI